MEERIKLIIDGNDKYLLPEEIQQKFDELAEQLENAKSNSDAWYNRYMQEWNEKREAFKTMRLMLEAGGQMAKPFIEKL